MAEILEINKLKPLLSEVFLTKIDSLCGGRKDLLQLSFSSFCDTLYRKLCHSDVLSCLDIVVAEENPLKC